MDQDKAVRDMMPYAPVLERMLDLLNKNPFLKYGDAFQQAKSEIGVEIPEAIERVLLLSAFKMSLKGFPTKVQA